MTDTALATTTEQDTGLELVRPPRDVLAQAHEAAAALMGVMASKKRKLVFNDEQYLEFEDWQTVGRFYGIAPRIVSTRFVEYAGAKGWEATAEAVHVQSQRVVSSADSMCLNDEEKWSERTKYEWVYLLKGGGTSVEDPGPDQIVWEPNPAKPGKRRPKKERMKVGTEEVPMFQLRSMAQTRAGAKALRNALAWVVVLAGYRPTPAEEMPEVKEIIATAEVVEEAPPPRETIDQEGDRLFKTPEEMERDEKVAVLESIAKGFALLKLSADEQKAKFFKHSGGVGPVMDPDAISLDALNALLSELRTLHASKVSRERK